MFRNHRSNMIRFKFLLFLILLPILTKSKNVRPNYPSSFEDDENSQMPFMDQVAQADTWKEQNRVISATYTGDPQTGRVDHANLVINVVPRSNARPTDVDVYATHTLANAKTAEDYVNKALQMKTKYDHTTPSSSFVKYDIYEAEKTKLVPVVSTPSHVTEPMIPMIPSAPQAHQKEDISDMSKSASEYTDFSIEHPQEYVAQTITTTYKHPSLTNHYKDLSSSSSYKDLEPSNSDHYSNHNHQHQHHSYVQGYDPYDTIRNINHDNRNNLDDVMRKLSGYPSKDEMIKYIERAVKKYLREYDFGGKLSLAGSPSAQGEIKTYYSFPSSTASPIESTKLYSAGIHSEFFKPSKGSYSTPSYSTVKPFAVESYIPEGIDLTIPSKKRPKPIDLSALDVGQSWSHSSQTHGEPVVTYRKKKKPKIHLSSQTHQDINALPYVPNRGLIYDDYSSPYSTPSAYSIDHSNSHYAPHKDHSVGASISFGGHSHGGHHHHHKHKHHSHHHDDSKYHHDDSKYHHDDSKTNFVPSMQVVNGIPITNPYKFNMDTLNDIFDNSGDKTKYSFSDPDFGSSTGAIWNPYNIDLNSLTSNRDNGLAASSTTYSFDTVNPKFNNNPEESLYDSYRYGVAEWDADYAPRQRGTIGSDMFPSATSQRAKKTLSSKRTVTKIIPKPMQRQPKPKLNKEPDRDLMPPPAKI